MKGGDSMMYARVLNSYFDRERLVSFLTADSFEGKARVVPCEGWSAASVVDVGGYSPFASFINITPTLERFPGCDVVRMTASTKSVLFAVSNLPSFLRQYQDIRYSSSQDRFRFFLNLHVHSGAKLKECGLNTMPLHTHSKLRFPSVISVESHSVATKGFVPAVGFFR